MSDPAPSAEGADRCSCPQSLGGSMERSGSVPAGNEQMGEKRPGVVVVNGKRDLATNLARYMNPTT